MKSSSATIKQLIKEKEITLDALTQYNEKGEEMIDFVDDDNNTNTNNNNNVNNDDDETESNDDFQKGGSSELNIDDL